MPSALATQTSSGSKALATNTGHSSRFWAVWDGTGAFASFLCMIHCVGVPILLSLFPGATLGLPEGIVKGELFHQVAATIATVLALSAFSRGYREHHSLWVIVLGVLGCALLFIATLGILHETGWTVVGSTLLIAAHLDNYRKIKSCARHPRGHHHSHF